MKEPILEQQSDETTGEPTPESETTASADVSSANDDEGAAFSKEPEIIAGSIQGEYSFCRKL